MTTGEAYGFFNSPASYDQIKQELPHIRYMAGTPDMMKTELMEGMEKLMGDPGLTGDLELMEILREAEPIRRYAMAATCPDMSNRQAAKELADVLAQLYWSPIHHIKDFEAEIFFKEGGKYILQGQE